MLDQIHIRELRTCCIIGVNPGERVNKQDVIIDLTLWADLRQAAFSDSLTDTVDYSAIETAVVDMVAGSEFFLVERLAQCIADLCLERPFVQRVRVLVEKPGALRSARTVGIELVREAAGDD